MILRPSEIKALRRKAGLTQAQLAKLAGVTQAYIAKIEAGKTDPKYSTLERISAVLLRGGKEKPLTAQQLMTSPIISVQRTDPVKRAVELMKSYDISQLPVFEGKTPVGSISERVLMRKIAAGERVSDLLKTAVGQVMEDAFPTVSEETTADVVYSLLEHSPAVLVVERGRAKGIITKADVLKLMLKYR
jgi:predicted transcriptional regulator